MQEHEITNLRNWCSKFFTQNNLALDIFDFDNEIDKKISYEENKTILREKLKRFLREEQILTLKEKAKETKNKIEICEYDLKKEIDNEEQNAKKEFENTILILKKSKLTAINKYKIPTEYLKAVARGYSKGFIFLGEQGTGKTYLTRQILSKENINFIESRGVSSPLALYHFLFENNKENSVIVLDDIAGLINNENAYSILLGALWDNLICWNSTTDKLKAPKQFIFKAKLIIIANKLTDDKAEIIKSRCLVYTINLNFLEKLEVMYLIAKQKHNILNNDERLKIVDFIKENIDESSIFDLRTQQKAEQLYLYDKEKWQELVKSLLTKNEILSILLECLKNNSTIRESQKEFREKTGYSRRSFFRIKRFIKCQ